jgi:dihydrofolate synthase / folylpolyglutamate synthase
LCLLFFGVQVGLGGKYDATNVVSTALSVICSVCKLFVLYFPYKSRLLSSLNLYIFFILLFPVKALDHTRVLGETVEAIAANKAGIFKTGVPAIVGPNMPMVSVQVLFF